MRIIKLFSVCAVLVVGGIGAGGASAAAKSFRSASGNIQCEVVSKVQLVSYAYCQTFSPARSVKLELTGV